MGFFKSVGRAFKKAASYVKEKVSDGLKWAREKATQACDWVVEKGEQFIDNVKEVYHKVKPFLQAVRPWIDKIATTVGLKFPWIGAALFGVGKVIDGLLALENSPVAKAVEKSLRSVIKFSKFIKERYLTPQEVEEAKENQINLQKAETFTKTVEQQKSVQFAQMLNNYGLVKVELRDTLEMGVADFQHYLRLRATQKLLDEADQKLTTAQNLDDISSDDVFLIQIAQQLIANAELSEQDSLKLDEIVQLRFGKSLIPFVFEELLVVWVDKQLSLEQQWKQVSAELAQDRVAKTRLEVAKKVSDLTSEEANTYQTLLNKLVGLETKLKRVDKERRSMKNYVYAAEGFMQILEKDDATLEAEDKDYLIDDSAEIASIIMRVAEHNTDWDTLTEDEKSLIIDYANIFEKEGKIRAEQLKQQIEVAA